MITLNPATRRQEGEFAAALENVRLEDLRTDDPELAELVALAVALRPAPVTPRAEFRAHLRERLVAEPVPAQRRAAAARRPAARSGDERLPTSPGRPKGRRIVGLVTATVVASGAGTAYASTAALPGDALYPVKRSLEAAERRVVAVTDEARGANLLDTADRRLGELEELVAVGAGGSAVERALTDFTGASEDGARLTLEAYDEDPVADRLVGLDSRLTDQEQRLIGLLPTLPGDLVAPLDRSVARLVLTGGAISPRRADCPDCPALRSTGAVLGRVLGTLPLTADAVREVNGLPAPAPPPIRTTPEPTPTPALPPTATPTPAATPTATPAATPTPTSTPTSSGEPSGTVEQPSGEPTPSGGVSVPDVTAPPSGTPAEPSPVDPEPEPEPTTGASGEPDPTTGDGSAGESPEPSGAADPLPTAAAGEDPAATTEVAAPCPTELC